MGEIVLRGIPDRPEFMVNSVGQVFKLWEFYANTREEKDVELKQSRNRGGCWVVNLSYMDPTTYKMVKVRTTVARLIALAFHGVPAPGGVAKHRDGNRSNNTPENVYWSYAATAEEKPVLSRSRSIPEHPGYLATENGYILKEDKSIVTQNTAKDGSKVVNITVNGKRSCRSVATLIALAWCGRKPKGFKPAQVYAKHKDGNRGNNAASNLYWRSPAMPTFVKPTEGEQHAV